MQLLLRVQLVPVVLAVPVWVLAVAVAVEPWALAAAAVADFAVAGLA